MYHAGAAPDRFCDPSVVSEGSADRSLAVAAQNGRLLYTLLTEPRPQGRGQRTDRFLYITVVDSRTLESKLSA
jgi:hypothetical protein